MDLQREIKEIEEALNASPRNTYLRKTLIAKLKEMGSEDEKLEVFLQESIRLFSTDVHYKSELIQCYFKQGKYAACLVVAEELEDLKKLPIHQRAQIANAHLALGEHQESRNIYQEILTDNPGYVDDKLDDAFRMKTVPGSDWEEEDLDALFAPAGVNFSDVGGMETVKREIDLKIIKPLENAELYAAYGKKIGGGILLYGPPGCGKTFIARATAGEINAHFVSVGLEDILDMWMGQSERNLSSVFDSARSNAPCVLFFDEVDALGAKRSDLKNSSGRNVINQFLAEMDGIKSENDGLLIIGATNTPWHLDPAFRRPGRFDRVIFVPPPDYDSRVKILELKLKDKPQSNINLQKVAKRTERYSGADLNAVIDIAIENVLERAMETGTPAPLTTEDLLSAINSHKPSTEEWFTTAKNYALFANKNGMYDDILKYIK